MAARRLRWLVVVAACTVVFVACVGLVLLAPIGWLPADDGIRWSIALGFAGAVSAAVGGSLGWWTTPRDGEPGGESGTAGRGRLRMTARASRGGEVYQAARDQHFGTGRGAAGGGAASGDGAPADIDMRARSRRGRIAQAGRDQHIGGSDDR